MVQRARGENHGQPRITRRSIQGRHAQSTGTYLWYVLGVCHGLPHVSFPLITFHEYLANLGIQRWPIYLIGLSWTIPNNPATSYLTLQLKANGFGTFQTNLLTIPAYVLFIIQLLFWTWVSEKVNQRFIVGLVSQIWVLPLLIALELIPGSTSAWTKWALSTLLVGYPYVHAILVSTSSRNAGSVRLRTVASAFYNMCVQTASIIGSNVRAFHTHSRKSEMLTYLVDLQRR